MQTATQPASQDASHNASLAAPEGPAVAPAQPIFADRLAEWLLAHEKLPEASLRGAQTLLETETEDLSLLLVRLGMVSERDVAAALAELTGHPLIAPDAWPALPINAEHDALPLRFMRERLALPVAETDDGLTLAMAMPHDRFTVRALEVALGKPVTVCTAVASDVRTHIDRLYGRGEEAGEGLEAALEGGDDTDDVQHLKDLASEAPVVRLVTFIINRAVELRASDIHIEPFEHQLKVRYRVDGVLSEAESPPARSTAAVISRIKLLARLNIAERRLPQDGRLMLRVQGKDIDMRVSTVPTMYGESVVLRILDKSEVVLDFEKLGFADDLKKEFLDLVDAPNGIVLVTGPTGSGKTTTLYTALDHLNEPVRKILTVEDPIEYQLEGVNQIQVKPQIGLSFADALRSIMRQDPDVIMIGEMRDLETARIAVQSALTGHLVLSTLHTNDAGSSVTRLLDMGVEDYLVTSTINGILAQRLVRRLCPSCRTPYRPLPDMVRQFGEALAERAHELTLYHPGGCDACGGSGFKGRVAVMELLRMTDHIRSLVLKHADGATIQRAALEAGMRSMLADGFLKALRGHTTIEEVLRVTRGED